MFYESLPEKDRRRYAAIEVMKLGFSGQKHICEILGCMLRKNKVGTDELLSGNLKKIREIRRPGGGKKKIIDTVCHLPERLQHHHDLTAMQKPERSCRLLHNKSF